MSSKNNNKKSFHKIDATNGGQSALDRETRSNIMKVAEIEEQQRAKRTTGEKISEHIAVFCGSMVFVYVHIIWFGGWILVNSVFRFARFDPFPYTFLTLVVSLEAIFLSTFILISQNHETRLTERRNDLDLQINLLAEKENTKILELLQRIARQVGVSHNDPDTEALLEPTDPERLVEQIISATGEPSEKQKRK